LSRPLIALVNTNLIKPAVGPIAFDYLHGPLVQAGYEVALLDLCFAESWQEAIGAWCKARRPDFWGVTLRNTDDTYFASQTSFVRLATTMIAALRRHHPVPIIVGGVGFSVMPEALMGCLGANFGIVAEGEISLPLLLDRLIASAPLGDVPGLLWYEAGSLRRNPTRFADLAAMPDRRRMFVDNVRYFAAGGMAGIETQRGCNRACIHCVEPHAKGSSLRRRSPAQIADEMMALIAQGVDTFHINDSEFNLDVAHALAFCGEIKSRGLASKIAWFAYGMPHPFPDELAASMVEAGCHGMNFGCDSANEATLRLIRRTFRRHHIASAIGAARRNQLPHIVELLIGFPGETPQTVRDSIDFIKQADPELVAVTIGIRIFPGTALARTLGREQLTPDNPNLFGRTIDNETLVEPVFYLTSELGPEPELLVAEIINDDPRFLPVNDRDFNYHANDQLVDAIANGARGAYWKILRDLRAKKRLAHMHGEEVRLPARQACAERAS
jgi:radical SAM superfamily enzyme YgiQ (UPF0313 family)